ncbi:ANTAR domain-containing protein [Streptomyces sp. NPDC102467]|uniref:ANTAR domain-containing protein n=1 Tax=Streptomyces sp. NPDC102467 TaxID=3366179 RepID=UPI00382BEA60
MTSHDPFLDHGAPENNAPVARDRADLEAQVARLREVVHRRAVVDQAVGVLLALGRITPAEARDALREMSARAGLTLPQVARHLVEYARSGELPDAVRTELARQLAVPRQRAAGAAVRTVTTVTQTGPTTSGRRPPAE